MLRTIAPKSHVRVYPHTFTPQYIVMIPTATLCSATAVCSPPKNIPMEGTRKGSYPMKRIPWPNEVFDENDFDTKKWNSDDWGLRLSFLPHRHSERFSAKKCYSDPNSTSLYPITRPMFMFTPHYYCTAVFHPKQPTGAATGSVGDVR